MARPKLGDSESKRLQMVITENEIAAVDDWQHAHKVSSRSEAIRRLVQIGLIANNSGSFAQAMHTLAHFIEDPSARDQMKSGRSLEHDVKRLCRIVWNEQLKIRDFLEKPLSDAFPSQQEWDGFFEKARRGEAVEDEDSGS